jgi:hypothetical protein
MRLDRRMSIGRSRIASASTPMGTSELAATEFGPSYRRATVIQASLTALGCLAAVVAWVEGEGVFASILDDDKGGRSQIAPVQNGISTKQFYWPKTRVLMTGFLSTDGVGEIEDFMPTRSRPFLGCDQHARGRSSLDGNTPARRTARSATHVYGGQHDHRPSHQNSALRCPHVVCRE